MTEELSDDAIGRICGGLAPKDLRIGELAVARGFLTPQQLEEILREQTDLRRGGQEVLLGQILLRRRLVDTNALADLVREHAAVSGSFPVFSRYEVVGELGEGAMAVVYRAVDRSLRRIVALKVMNESFRSEAQLRERFRREAEAAARLSHPYVLTVYDAGEENGRCYLVMELVRGEPMTRVLGERRLDLRALVQVVEKVARGVQHAHEQGIVHRDLKPANILVTAAGEPKVVDFGMAHLMEAATKLTRSGAVVGTPVYMAPEQVRGDPAAISARTDVYALGTILYEAVTGAPPFLGATTAELFHKILRDEPVRPRKRNDRIPKDLETITLKAIEKSPARRYATMKEFGGDLERYLNGEPIQAKPATWTQRAVKKVRRNAAVSAALALAALTVLAGAAAYGAARWKRAVEMSRIEREADSTGPERSVELWAQLQSMGHPRAVQGLDRAKRRRALEEVERARSHLSARNDAARRAREVDSEAREVRASLPSPPTVAAKARLWELQRALEEARQRERREETLAEQSAQSALRFSDIPEARDVLARIYFERWEAAESRRDRDAMALWEPLAVSFGGEEVRRRISDPAVVRIDAGGADAYLFRYDAAGPRLVPVPVGAEPPEWPSIEPLPPGATDEEKARARENSGYPLRARPENRVSFPRTLPAGSYLVLVAGASEVRIPLWLERGQTVDLKVRIPDEVPEGYVFIAGGPAILEQDPSVRENEERRVPARRTEVGEFFLARFETQVGEYAEFLADRGHHTSEEALRRIPRTGGGGLPRWPDDTAVTGVSWHDAAEFARWRTLRKGRGKWVFRLPTAQEWEKAARGADGRFHAWGDGYEGLFFASVESRGPRGSVDPVGLFPADESPFGVRDMTGGVREWVASEADGGLRVVKGGVYGSRAFDIRPANAIVRSPDTVDPTLGFRLAADRK